MVRILLNSGATIVIEKGKITEGNNKELMQKKYGFGIEGASPSIPDPDFHIANLILKDYSGQVVYRDIPKYEAGVVY